MRRILIVLTGGSTDAKAANAAVQLADRLGAHAEAVFIRLDPSEFLPRIGESVSGAVVDQLVEIAAKSSDENSARARKTFEEAAKAKGVTMLKAAAEGPGPGAFYYSVQGPSIEALGREARLADLVVFGDPGADDAGDLMAKIEHVLFAVNRPVLIARGRVQSKLGDNIFAGYDGGTECSSALQHARPILATAKSVSVTYIKSSARDPGRAAQALRYLSQHGIEATAHDVRMEAESITADLMARVKKQGADMIVMGAYGHSRLREFIFGGTTRHAIMQSSVPVFLAR